jgi:signal transduction histidine kinase/CheY-like chemotaxis protein
MFRFHRLLLAAAFAIPLGLLALSGWLNFRQIHQEEEHHAQQNVEALSEHAQRTFRIHELLIDFVDSHVRGRTWSELAASEALHRELARLAGSNTDVASIFLLDPQGRTFISSRRFPMPPIDASDREYFRVLQGRDGLHVSAPAHGRLSNDRFFTLARRRSTPDGRFDGLIAVSVSPSYFESFYAPLRESPQDTIGLVRTDGTMLVREPPLPQSGIVLPQDSVFMQNVRRSPEGGVFTAASVADGQERIFAYRRVGNYPVYASFNTSMMLVWSAWRWAMLPYLLASLLVMGILLVGAALAEQRTRRAAAEARSREAEQASRAKDLFLAALSHELRNPLAAISNASEALRRNPASRGAVEIISRQIAQLRRLLDDLLDTARAVYGKLGLERRRIDLRLLAETTAAEQFARTGVQARVQVSGDEPWVDGDPVRLKQMLDNLVDNAIKYGGRRIEVRIESGADWVELAVADNGQGIAPELLPRIFEPFVQGEQPLDRAQGGLGLGLALVNRLALLHGGTLAAESEGPGQGSRFTLRLPRAGAPARPVDVAAAGVDGKRHRLLVVDDEPDARDSLRALLELDGHQVAVAADGPMALQLIESVHADIALVDIGLPGLDGYELARRLRARAPELALVAVTGYGQAQDREKARAVGFDAHLTKPFSYSELAAVIVRVAGNDRAERQRTA